MAAAAVIGSIVAGLAPAVIGATKKPEVVDTTPPAPGYFGASSFADAFDNEKEKPNYKNIAIGVGAFSVLAIIVLMTLKWIKKS